MNSSFFNFDIILPPSPLDVKSRALGANEKRIMILFECDKDNFKDQEAYLEKILAAAKINLQKDTVYFNLTDKESISFQQLNQIYTPNYLLLFGLSPDRIGLQVNYQPYTPFVFQSKQLLFVDALGAILEEKQRKERQMAGLLWKNLQAMFLT